MAKLNNVATVGATAESSLAMLASLGVLCGMIFTLLTIKIWWFKHRLTFDHSATNNGAAGGSAPAVAMRSRSSKDKRLSQQIREPVELHGVFRKRQEDDFDIVPTKQLPPVRIRKLSASTPSLFQPPKRNIEMQRNVIAELQPPTREPPKPPVDSLQTTSPKSTAVATEMSDFAELEQKFQRMETQATAQPARDEHEVEFDAPHSEQQQETNTLPHKFVKARSTSEPERALAKLQERRATGYLRPNEDDLRLDAELQAMLAPQCSVEEFGERRPTGYIKYAEIDDDGLEDFNAKWQNVQTNIDDPIEHDNEMGERHHYERYHAATHALPTHHSDEAHQQHVNTNTKEMPSAVIEEVIHEVESLEGGHAASATVKRTTWETVKEPTSNTSESASFEEGAFGERKSSETLAENRLLSWNASPSYSTNDEEDTFGERKSMETQAEDRPLSWNANPNYATEQVHQIHERPQNLQVHKQHFKEQQSDGETSHTVQFALPYDKTSCDNDIEEKDTRNMRRPTGYVPHNLQLWAELEHIVKQEDDDKQLWQEMQDELTEDLVSGAEEEFNKIRNSYEENEADFLEPCNVRRILKQIELPSPEPDGFGKSIDEDWESFEHLTDGHRPAHDSHLVQFNLPHAETEEYDKESTLRTTRRPTGFVKNVTAFHTELELESDDGSSCDESVNISSIKERRPTGYVRPNAKELEDEYEHEHCKESIFEPADLTHSLETTHKPKPRQKVTFDFTTTEYYLASDNASAASRQLSEDEAVDAQYGSGAALSMPQPMQRITKMQYNSAYSSDSGVHEMPNISPPPAPILFGTHLSYDEAEADANDSWAAIRQRRCTYEEIQQQQHHTEVSVGEPPRPAYRNPLAQSSTIEPERPAPHAQARKHNFDDNYGVNTTEA